MVSLAEDRVEVYSSKHPVEALVMVSRLKMVPKWAKATAGVVSKIVVTTVVEIVVATVVSGMKVEEMTIARAKAPVGIST